MTKWIWDTLIMGALEWALTLPWYIWAIPAAVIIGLAVKLYKVAGWQGILGALVFVLTVGAYKQGWNDAARRRGPNSFDKPVEVPKPRTRVIQDIFTKSPKRQPKRRYNRDTNVWEPVDGSN